MLRNKLTYEYIIITRTIHNLGHVQYSKTTVCYTTMKTLPIQQLTMCTQLTLTFTKQVTEAKLYILQTHSISAANSPGQTAQLLCHINRITCHISLNHTEMFNQEKISKTEMIRNSVPHTTTSNGKTTHIAKKAKDRFCTWMMMRCWNKILYWQMEYTKTTAKQAK